MVGISVSKLPANALSSCYANEGAFADCYYVDVHRQVTLGDYIQTFYTTPLFKMERAILSVFARKSSNDSEVEALSLGRTQHFSIWTVEIRESNQILLCDFTRKTRSWLMIDHLNKDNSIVTRLYFGSVVIPRDVTDEGRKSFGLLFHLLSGFHRLYSQALLKSAYEKLTKVNSEV